MTSPTKARRSQSSRGMSIPDWNMADILEDDQKKKMSDFGKVLSVMGSMFGGAPGGQAGGLGAIVDMISNGGDTSKIRIERPGDPGFGGGDQGNTVDGGASFQDLMNEKGMKEARDTRARNGPNKLSPVVEDRNPPRETTTTEKTTSTETTPNNYTTRFIGIYDDRESGWAVGGAPGGSTLPQPSMLDKDKYEIVGDGAGDSTYSWQQYVYEKVPTQGGPQAPEEEKRDGPETNQDAFEMFPFMDMPTFNLLGQQGDKPSVPQTQSNQFKDIFDFFNEIFTGKFTDQIEAQKDDKKKKK